MRTTSVEERARSLPVAIDFLTSRQCLLLTPKTRGNVTQSSSHRLTVSMIKLRGGLRVDRESKPNRQVHGNALARQILKIHYRRNCVVFRFREIWYFNFRFRENFSRLLSRLPALLKITSPYEQKHKSTFMIRKNIFSQIKKTNAFFSFYKIIFNISRRENRYYQYGTTCLKSILLNHYGL